MGKKSGPSPPDPKELAKASTGTNIATAVANQALQSGDRAGPGGSVTQTQTGTQNYTDPYTGESYEIPVYSTEQQFSEQQQSALGQAQAAPQGDYGQTGTGGITVGPQGQFNNQAGPAGQFDNQYQGVTGTAQRDRVEDALRQRTQGVRDEANDRRGIELARRGLGSFSTQTGGEGKIADASRQRQERQENDASLAITAAGGQEQALQDSLRQSAFGRDAATFGLNEGANQAAFGRDISAFGANQQANQQTFGQQSALAGLQDNFANSGLQREQAQANQGINALNATLSGGSVPQGIGGQIPTTDVGGIINQNYQQRAGQHQQRQGQRNQWLGGLFGLGSAFLA